MVTLGQQNWAAEAWFNATQLNTRSIDPDQMEYDRITDITEGVESLSAVTLFAGAGLAHHFTDQLFIRASANGTLTTSRYNASAMVQQRGHYVVTALSSMNPESTTLKHAFLPLYQNSVPDGELPWIRLPFRKCF